MELYLSSRYLLPLCMRRDVPTAWNRKSNPRIVARTCGLTHPPETSNPLSTHYALSISSIIS